MGTPHETPHETPQEIVRQSARERAPQQSLALFAELAPAPAPRALPSAGQRHLAAANRLAKRMRRLKGHSEEQTKAGQAICRHLLALLEESSTTPGDLPSTLPGSGTE